MANEIMTFDEILTDPLYKSEFDRRVTKALATVQGKLELAEDKLKTTETALKKFEGIDVAALQGEIAALKTDLADKDTEYKGRIADMEFNGLLDSAITGAKGRNPKALRGLLDVDTLKASKNQTEDIKAALEALKASDGYLFEDAETPPPYAAGTGTQPTQNQKYTPEVSAIRAAAGLKTE